MPKRSSSPDLNEIAARVVREATAEEKGGGNPEEPAAEPTAQEEKNPAAVALGKLGGKKGGPARAEKLTAERRKEIAREGAAARWAKKQPG